MKIKIVCVGNIKENYYVLACNEYIKRISRFVKIDVVEIKEEKLPANFSNNTIQNIKQLEGERILENIEGYAIACDLKGKMLNSLELSKTFKKIEQINSTISIIIGGSYGLSQKVLDKSDLKIAFSELTFPHQLFRVMLLEQLYRAYTIINNITYHK